MLIKIARLVGPSAFARWGRGREKESRTGHSDAPITEALPGEAQKCWKAEERCPAGSGPRHNTMLMPDDGSVIGSTLSFIRTASPSATPLPHVSSGSGGGIPLGEPPCLVGLRRARGGVKPLRRSETVAADPSCSAPCQLTAIGGPPSRLVQHFWPAGILATHSSPPSGARHEGGHDALGSEVAMNTRFRHGGPWVR